MSLNAKQKKFCEVLVKNGLNATQAYKAVYNTKTSRASETGASRMMRNDEVSQYINYLQEKATDDTIMSRTEVLRELSRLGRGHLGKVAVWDADRLELKDSEHMTDEELSTVQSVKQTTSEYGGSMEIKQYDKIKPLELLAKHYGALDGSKDDDDTGTGETTVSKVLDSLRKLRK